MKAVGIIVGVAVLAIVGAVALNMLNGLEDPSPVGGEWSYDDYKIVPDAVSASGSLELVDVDGTAMVHAMSVGPGRISMSDGTTEEVDVARAILDVYLMTGQSNASYRSENPSAASPAPPIGTAWFWGDAAGNWGDRGTQSEFAMRPMVDSDGTLATADMAPAFAASVEAAGVPDGKVFWICGATGNRSISTFVPGEGSSWAHMKLVVEEAIEAIPSDLFAVRTVCYMWIQGEADAGMSVDLYKERFMLMHDAILDGGLGHDFDHCFISLLTSKWTNSRAAQLELASEHPDTITIATDVADTFTVDNGLMQADGTHYTQLGDNIIGTDLGEFISEWYSVEPVPEVDSGTGGLPSLLGVVPILLGIAVGLMAIGLALRAIMGRD